MLSTGWAIAALNLRARDVFVSGLDRMVLEYG